MPTHLAQTKQNNKLKTFFNKSFWSSSSRMRVMNHNWSATKQHPHPQSAAETRRHSVLSGDRIRQCGRRLA